MDELAIKIEHVSKQYRLGAIGGGTLKGDLQTWWARKRGREDPNSKIGADTKLKIGEKFLALDDINLEVKKGEALGIIGHNGAGKSTLLKLLSRVTAPTTGKISYDGRITSMLEVGTGFHPELTGRENIYMNGAILGLTKAEINEKIEQIIDFSEVRQFIDTPVKRYSSGMYVKLAFSVAAHLDSEIMIMDEVLAVGDMAFQKKCLTKMREAADKEGRTVLYVSHNMNTIRQLCDRVIVLEKGKIIFDGEVEEGIKLYSNSNSLESTFTDFSDYVRPSYYTQLMSLDSAAYLNKDNIEFCNNEVMRLRLQWHNLQDIKNAGLRVELWTLDDTPQASYILYDLYSGKSGERAELTLELDLSPIAEAEYRMKYIFFQNDSFGNNSDIEMVRGLCLRKKNHQLKHELTWYPRRWGYVILPTPRYHLERKEG